MKVLGKRVLIEQKMVKKKSVIIRTNNSKEEDVYDIHFKVLQLGSECPENEIKVGDTPIFGKHTQFNTVKVLKKTEKEVILNAIIHYDDIEGIDDEV